MNGFLPIVERELRVSSRRAATWRMRFFAAMAVTAVWFLMMLAPRSAITMKQDGHLLFIFLSVMALAFCLLAGVFLTADSLAEEKREGTLGFLFLTDLTGVDVVFGKLVATSLNAAYGLLAAIPVLGLPLLLGGVTGGEFWRVIIVLIMTLFWSLSIGLAVSSCATETRGAMTRSFLFIVLSSGILPAIWCLEQAVTNVPWVEMPFLWPSPAYALRRSLDLCYNFSPGSREFWGAIGTVFVVGLGGIGFACRKLPRVWHEVGGSQDTIPLAADTPSRSFRLHLKRVVPAPLANFTNPFKWLAVRDRLEGRFTHEIFAGFSVLIWLLILMWCATDAKEWLIVAMFSAYGLHQILKFKIATEASRRISEDRRSGALELILLTPLPERDILDAQWAALKEQFRGPIRWLISLNIGLLAAVWCTSHMGDTDRSIFARWFVGGALILWTDFSALAWAGMWNGLTASRHHRAVFRAVGWVMLIPWIGIFLIVFIIMGRAINGSGAILLMSNCWLAGSLAIGIMARVRARKRLNSGFRLLAVGSFDRQR